MKENSIYKKILIYLGETSKNLLDLGITALIDTPSLTKEISLSRDYLMSPYFISHRLNKLKRWGYLEEKRIKDKQRWCFTKKGRIEIIKNILKNKSLKWDKKWRAIIFDIPELSRKDRDFLRRELQWIGFKELQKSVWIYPYQIEKELVALLNLWKIDFKGDIRFLTIEKMSDTDLKKHFGLQ